MVTVLLNDFLKRPILLKRLHTALTFDRHSPAGEIQSGTSVKSNFSDVSKLAELNLLNYNLFSCRRSIELWQANKTRRQTGLHYKDFITKLFSG